MDFKEIVFKNSFLMRVFCLISNILYYPLNFVSSSGVGNKINFGKSVFKKRVKVKIRGNNNYINILDKCRLRNTTIQIKGHNNSITLGSKVVIYEDVYIMIEGDSTSIVIGNNTTIGSAKLFLGEGNTCIKIGNDCMISRNVTMNTSDFHSVIDIVNGKRLNPPKSISIGNHVWIGNGAYIAKGAYIGEDCVVAARGYVSGKVFDNNTLIGGLPAKVLRDNINWDRAKLPY